MDLDEFMASDYEEGHKYELINGRLYVTPIPNLPENRLEEWIGNHLREYARNHPMVINYVSSRARVFVPGRRGTTNPEPDLAAYRNFPIHRPLQEVRWQDVSPVLVIEVLSADDPEKDLVRNVALYWQVPTIREYWIFDSRTNPDQPLLKVYRRHGKKWRIIDVAPGDTYVTKLLPGFQLILDPRT
jgi:Uma2 family endonuclease